LTIATARTSNSSLSASNGRRTLTSWARERPVFRHKGKQNKNLALFGRVEACSKRRVNIFKTCSINSTPFPKFLGNLYSCFDRNVVSWIVNLLLRWTRFDK
jgi:hypothetical protein